MLKRRVIRVVVVVVRREFLMVFIIYGLWRVLISIFMLEVCLRKIIVIGMVM